MRKFTLPLLIVANLTLSFTSSTSMSAPWAGYGLTTPTKFYKDDQAYEANYKFGITGTYLSYRDPNFSEALDDNAPLSNPNYSSYNIIIVVNKETNSTWGRAQTMRVYHRKVEENNGLLYYWLVSTGIRGFETPSGYFVPQSFSSRHWSKQFDAPMLNSVFFQGGKAFHTSIDNEAMMQMGTAFSHGCVHVEDHRAKELFHLIGHSGYGSVDKINGKSGEIEKTAQGSNVQVNSYKTLIIIK